MLSALFAYGTLMPGDPEAAVEDGWEADAVRGLLYDLGPYPALIGLGDPGAGWVEGYVRRGISDDQIRRLDAYEETDRGVYRRVGTITRNDRRVWVYIYDRPLPGHALGPLSRWEGSVRVRLSSLLASQQGDS